jgi:hypothetical protein
MVCDYVVDSILCAAMHRPKPTPREVPYSLDDIIDSCRERTLEVGVGSSLGLSKTIISQSTYQRCWEALASSARAEVLPCPCWRDGVQS